MSVAGYIIYLKKYKISEEYYAQILQDLDQRETAQKYANS
jgi:Na+/melibiose symporter-like transporter